MLDEPSILLSDNTGAALLGISRASWWRRVNDGTLPRPLKIGGATRWARDEIDAVIDRAKRDRDEAAAA